ncbi:MAG: PEP/pyruvate-binding domain-containing protein [Candidatus Wallbacteria bacterium]
MLVLKKFVITKNDNELTKNIKFVGGKGANLFSLSGFGVNVPAFIVLSTELFDYYVNEILGGSFNKAVSELDCSTPAAIAKTGSKLRSLFKSSHLPKDVSDKIIKSVRENIGDNVFCAVRSSAEAEDSKEFSYAGQLDSFLFCKTDSEILDAVLGCFASGFSDRAIAYRNVKSIPNTGVKVAVVIQKMINGAVSGVAFTVNPISKKYDEILISAVPGLGEGLVSGELNSDQYVCRKFPAVSFINSEVIEKSEKIIFDVEKGYGTKRVNVEGADAKKACLSTEQALALAVICKNIEANYQNKPQDIEWTIEYGEKGPVIYILQARPITTLDVLRPSALEYKTIWDNSNIVESYSGITSPLTFSFALNAYHMVYVQFCEVLKVPAEKIIENDVYFANMLGLLHGRVYYNIKNWCRLISVLPGYNYNRRFMEQMMGVKQKIDFTPADTSKGGFFKKYFVELPRLMLSGLALARAFFTIESRIKDFMSIYQRMFDKYHKYDFQNSQPHKLMDIYYELENTVLRNWKAPIINDFMAMIFFGLLKLLIDKWGLDAGGNSLHNELVAGQGNVESTLPMRKLQEIAGIIKNDAALSEVFKNNTEENLKEMFISGKLSENPDSYKKVSAMILEYLDEFGFRSMNELKLEVPSLTEKPQFLFSILKNYVSANSRHDEQAGEKEREIRTAAEKAVGEKLAGKKFLFVFSKQRLFDFIVRYTKKAVAFREYQRFARTKMFGLARMIFVGIGRQFCKLNVINDYNDIFYLNKDEIFSFIAGTSTIQNLKGLIELRKSEYAAFEKMEDLPDRLETYGSVYCNDLTVASEGYQNNINADGSGEIKGTCCCPGIVRGRVKVILNPSDDMSLNGEILVAARTDPGWVPLFPSAAGLLIERGSILSHSAIVARELGLPAIVGITNITKILKTGDIVEMDGAKGIVRIVRE